MKYQCTKCERLYYLEEGKNSTDYLCTECEIPLPATPVVSDNSTAISVGMIGGAALGASIGGPWGAIIGGVIGNAIGRSAKL